MENEKFIFAVETLSIIIQIIGLIIFGVFGTIFTVSGFDFSKLFFKKLFFIYSHQFVELCTANTLKILKLWNSKDLCSGD